MKQHEYRAIHTAIKVVFGKPNKCEMCNNTRNSKRLEWSNKNHKYTLERKKWWELCTKCHKEYDAKKFGKKVAWNKGLRFKGTKICGFCRKEFKHDRKEQVYCGQSCSGKAKGEIYLIENKLIKL